ncbi:hypothetical protein [Geodermatophilus sp. FMUSA9-8]|uniref:hypothetical protein n=1 Tax=Geodermatophilus sp. FMUSA9-8 TaxID=3120155 RepID=UPI00300819B3
MHLPSPAVLLTAVHAAALAVAVAAAATGSVREALAGLVVAAALGIRFAVHRSRRAARSTGSAITAVDAALPDALPDALAAPLPDAVPAVRAA